MQRTLTFYQKNFDEYSSRLKLTSKKLRWYGWYRFLSFIAIFLPLFVLGTKNWLTLIISLSFTSLFFFLLKKNFFLEKQKRKFSVLTKLVEDELLALKHSFSHFQNGREFLNTEHFFSYDLDLFGEGSLFQFLNRTTTIGGRRKLSTWLIVPLLSKNKIISRQEAIAELSKKTEWRLNFQASGKLFEENEEMSRELKSWSELNLQLNRGHKIKWLIWVVPALTILSLALSVFGFTSLPFVFFVLAQWFLLYFFWSRITQYFYFFGRKSELLAKYMQLLKVVEESNFESDYLNELQQKLTSPELASHIFKQLKSLVKEFEYRQNILVGVVLNSLFLWDIRCVYRLWKWHGKNHHKLAEWIDVVSETDALVSLGNYACNHPGFVYPEVQESDFVFQAEGLGHPLLEAGKRVCNDFEINGLSKVVIVTGANMAGKSTFLRTVGVNLILARVGAPVCATKMKFTPIEIYTNMRTTDSLLKDESYFFAELKRIKGVLDRLQNGDRIFVILDEMLKGTNSIDKLNGSKELIRKLAGLESVSLIATHDLKLSELADDFPGQVFNKCFEIRIENDELVFDYKLSDGVTSTMNATFLMKKMGII